MSKAPSCRRVTLITLLSALTVPFLLAACGGGGGGEGGVNDTDLAVIYFSHRGRTDVYRNQVLEFRFTAPVKKSSLEHRTLRILSGAGQETPVSGARILGSDIGLDGDRIFFDPSKSQHVYDRDGMGGVPDQPFGFESLANHTVLIPGYPEQKTLRNMSGSPLLATYTASFTTSDLFIPEQDPPAFLGYRFVPPPNEDGTINYQADLILEFDEAMDPSTVDPGNTLTVYRRITIDTPGGPVVKQGYYPVSVEASKDGRTFRLSPSINWGSEAEVTITVSDGIRDLAGNPIVPRPVNASQTNPFVFVTEYKDGLTLVDFINEDFATNVYHDEGAIIPADSGDWNTTEAGALLGGPITQSEATVTPAANNSSTFLFNISWPLVADKTTNSCPLMPSGVTWTKGIRLQSSFAQSELGGKGSITEILWGPSSTYTFPATHPNIEIRLGHMNNTTGVLGTDLTANFQNSAVPTPHYSGEYSIPLNQNVTWWPFPKLTAPFDYNGTNAVVVDYQISAAPDCQGWICWAYTFLTGGPGRRVAGAQDRSALLDDGFITAGGRTPEIILYTRFIKKRRVTQAQSYFYDTQVPNPDYSAAVVSPQVQAGGASYLLEVQGADAVFDPGTNRWVDNPATYTAWTADVNSCDGKRMLRFRFTLYSNMNSNSVARITSLQIPYTFGQ
ncbi:MAG: Ig-like domain-containing protein [Planctomycetes bacterium]|jgi:hypothetical protein|nr:Ig-like domain-containing protein [Planctomycetota bacterium]